VTERLTKRISRVTDEELDQIIEGLKEIVGRLPAKRMRSDNPIEVIDSIFGSTRSA